MFVVGHLAGKVFGAVDDRVDRFAAGATNSFVSATLIGVFWLTLRALDIRRGPAVAAALVLSLVAGASLMTWQWRRMFVSSAGR